VLNSLRIRETRMPDEPPMALRERTA